LLKLGPLFLASLVLISCTGEDIPRNDSVNGEYVAVYRFDGHALLPEYERLPQGDPVEGLITLLGAGPQNESLSNFVPEGSYAASSEREGATEQLVLRLNDVFWDRPAGEVYAGVAQIVYTVATLEQGREVLLLDDTVPGEVLDGSFDPIEQPLDRDRFSDVRPWIEIIRPVAGAVVGRQVPVEVRLREGSADIELLREAQGVEEVLAGDNAVRRSVSLEVDRTVEGPVVLSVSNGTHMVRLPLTLTS
jgi:hypothetical protein